MPHKVFFSFHYKDLWRVNVVRNTGLVEGFAVAGFHDASLWEETQRMGGDAIKRLIDQQLEGTSVTIVLIGLETAKLRWIAYEIERSVACRHGVFGIRINSIKDQHGRTDLPGQIPAPLLKLGAPVYEWEFGKLGQWVEGASKAANP
jgi:hypothetical protein